MSGPPKVLLVGHDASRSGAPALALRWLRWASAHGAAELAVWLDRGGDLLGEFESTCSTQVGSGLRHRLVREVVGRPGGPARGKALLRLIGAPGHDLGAPPIVVANTTAAWASAAAVRDRRRLVVWVHELDHVAERILPVSERVRLLEETDHLIAVGDRVADMLRDRWGVPPAKVSMVRSFTDPLPAPAEPTGAHDVVAVGSLTPRKGPDLFVAAVAALRADLPGVRAAWIGGPVESPTADLVRHDIASAQLDGLELLGAVPDATAWLPAEGVLLHTAREDPDPLAVLEAAVRGVPVVTWDTGGAADLLRQAGLDHLVAPAGDVLGLAARVLPLLRDPDARRAAGAALQAAAAERTTEHGAPQVLAAIVGPAR